MLLLLAPLSAILLLGVVGGMMVARSRQDRVARVVVGQMAMVMSQNLPMGTGLMLAAQGERGKARRVLRQIAELITAGLPLSEAVSRGYPKASAMVKSVIEVGERGGRLPAVLRMLQEELVVREERRNGGMDGVFYGVILLAVLFVVWSAMTVVVYPKLHQIAEDFGTTLPPLTIMATAPGRWNVVVWPWVVMALLLTMLAIIRGGHWIFVWGLRSSRAGGAEGVSLSAAVGSEKSRWHRPTIQEIAAVTVVLLSGILVCVISMLIAVNVAPSVGRFSDWAFRSPTGLAHDAVVGIGELGQEMPIEMLVAIGFLVAIPMAVDWGLRGRRVGKPYLSSRIADHVRWFVPGLRRMEMCKGLAMTCGLVRVFTRAGMGLQRAVRLAAEADMNVVLRERLLRLADRLDEGVPPPTAAQEARLGEVFTTALRAGQYGDQLDVSLRYAEAYHRSMVSRIWVTARTLSWPVATLVVAVFIGAFVLALFLPLVRMIQAVSSQV